MAQEGQFRSDMPLLLQGNGTFRRSENKDKSEANNSSEKTVMDVNHHVEKVKMAVNDKDQALKKATVAKNAANNVKHILDFVRKKDGDEQKDVTSDCSGTYKVFAVAVRLHRAINSSPRIPRDDRWVNSCSDDFNNGNLNGLSCKRLVPGGDESEDQSANSAEIERNSWTNKKSLYSNVNELAAGPLMYKRKKKRKTWQEIRSSLPKKMKFRSLKDSGTGGPTKWNSDIWEILVWIKVVLVSK